MPYQPTYPYPYNIGVDLTKDDGNIFSCKIDSYDNITAFNVYFYEVATNELVGFIREYLEDVEGVFIQKKIVSNITYFQEETIEEDLDDSFLPVYGKSTLRFLVPKSIETEFQTVDFLKNNIDYKWSIELFDDKINTFITDGKTKFASEGNNFYITTNGEVKGADSSIIVGTTTNPDETRNLGINQFIKIGQQQFNILKVKKVRIEGEVVDIPDDDDTKIIIKTEENLLDLITDFGTDPDPEVDYTGLNIEVAGIDIYKIIGISFLNGNYKVEIEGNTGTRYGVDTGKKVQYSLYRSVQIASVEIDDIQKTFEENSFYEIYGNCLRSPEFFFQGVETPQIEILNNGEPLPNYEEEQFEDEYFGESVLNLSATFSGNILWYKWKLERNINPDSSYSIFEVVEETKEIFGAQILYSYEGLIRGHNYRITLTIKNKENMDFIKTESIRVKYDYFLSPLNGIIGVDCERKAVKIDLGSFKSIRGTPGEVLSKRFESVIYNGIVVEESFKGVQGKVNTFSDLENVTLKSIQGVVEKFSNLPTQDVNDGDVYLVLKEFYSEETEKYYSNHYIWNFTDSFWELCCIPVEESEAEIGDIFIDVFENIAIIKTGSNSFSTRSYWNTSLGKIVSLDGIYRVFDEDKFYLLAREDTLEDLSKKKIWTRGGHKLSLSYDDQSGYEIGESPASNLQTYLSNFDVYDTEDEEGIIFGQLRKYTSLYLRFSNSEKDYLIAGIEDNTNSLFIEDFDMIPFLNKGVQIIVKEDLVKPDETIIKESVGYLKNKDDTIFWGGTGSNPDFSLLPDHMLSLRTKFLKSPVRFNNVGKIIYFEDIDDIGQVYIQKNDKIQEILNYVYEKGLDFSCLRIKIKGKENVVVPISDCYLNLNTGYFEVSIGNNLESFLIMGKVEDYEDLPIENMVIGDIYFVQSEYKYYIYTDGSEWSLKEIEYEIYFYDEPEQRIITLYSENSEYFVSIVPFFVQEDGEIIKNQTKFVVHYPNGDVVDIPIYSEINESFEQFQRNNNEEIDLEEIETLFPSPSIPQKNNQYIISFNENEFNFTEGGHSFFFTNNDLVNYWFNFFIFNNQVCVYKDLGCFTPEGYENYEDFLLLYPTEGTLRNNTNLNYTKIVLQGNLEYEIIRGTGSVFDINTDSNIVNSLNLALRAGKEGNTSYDVYSEDGVYTLAKGNPYEWSGNVILLNIPTEGITDASPPLADMISSDGFLIYKNYYNDKLDLIKQKVLTHLPKGKKTIYDYVVGSGQTYSYTIFPIFSTPVVSNNFIRRVQHYGTSFDTGCIKPQWTTFGLIGTLKDENYDEEDVIFWGKDRRMYVVDKNNIWQFGFNMENTSIQINTDKTIFETQTKLPKIGKALKNFKSGTLKGFLGSVRNYEIDHFYTDGEQVVKYGYTDNIKMMEDLQEFADNGEIKLLRDRRGNLIPVDITLESFELNDQANPPIITFSFNWTQVKNIEDFSLCEYE